MGEVAVDHHGVGREQTFARPHPSGGAAVELDGLDILVHPERDAELPGRLGHPITESTAPAHRMPDPEFIL